MRFELERVTLMPKNLREGVLYASEEYRTAAHLCACGCGSKIRTPLGPTEWTVKESAGGVTLSPSVGNWQQPCRSHYLIVEGEVRWASAWSDEAVLAGRKREEERRAEYLNSIQAKKPKVLALLWNWIKSLFRR